MSEIQVNTINEYTGANGVTIDGVLLKDNKLASGTGNVLQVVQNTLTTTVTTTAENSGMVDTGLSQAITPSSTSSKILVLVNIGQVSWNADTVWSIGLKRGTTDIGVGDASGNRIRIHAGGGLRDNASWQGQVITGMFLDSPATTSETTYKVQFGGNGVATIYINRSERDHEASGDNDQRAMSSLTLMEIGG